MTQKPNKQFGEELVFALTRYAQCERPFLAKMKIAGWRDKCFGFMKAWRYDFMTACKKGRLTP